MNAVDLHVLRAEFSAYQKFQDQQRTGDLRALDLQAREYDRRLKELDKKLDAVSRLVYIGVGILLVAEIVIRVTAK
jgi:hypothetical protein